MSKMIIVEGNSNDKDNVRALMVKGEKGDPGDLSGADIVDNLISTDNTKVLSANQGKVLKDLADKKPYYFNNVAEMKAYDLQVGDYAITKGFSSINDGGCKAFIIREKETTDVDGEKGVFILDNDNVAEIQKETNAIELNPSVIDNEIISNLTINNSSTSSGTAGITLDGQTGATIIHNDITGGYWSARIGNENDSNNTTGIKLVNNKLTSPHGLSLRHKNNSDNGGEHTLLLNEVNNTASNPGVESWAKKVQILFNRIKNISGEVGGTGGITLGAKPNQLALGNYISGFHYGIELGNSNLDIVSNNFIENSGIGLVCSSDNSDDIIINNNIVKVITNGDGIYLRSGKRVIIDNCIIIYGESLGDYNNSTSRSGKGLVSDTYNKDVIISNSSFINLAEVRFADGTKVSNCNFYNISNVYVSGNVIFENCLFRNVNNIGVSGATSKIQIFNNCIFKKDLDNTTMNTFIINGRGNSTPGIAEFNNCININCEIDSMRQNSEMGADKRFIAEKINGIYHTFNKAQLSDIKSDFESMGYSLNRGDKIIDNYNNKVWEVMTQNRHISYQNAVPTTGAFVKGDKIYNNLASSTTVEYWLCTVAGEFGTTTEPTFVAHNI